MGVSLRGYARHRGVTLKAVQKAISSGRIRTERDGTIDPEQADADWAANTRQHCQRSPSKAARESSVTESAPAQKGGKDISQRNRREDGARLSLSREDREMACGLPEGAAMSYSEALEMRLLYEGKLLKLKLDEKEGVLADQKKLCDEVFSRARQVRDRLMTLPHKLGPVCAAEKDAEGIRKLLHDALADALDSMASPDRYVRLGG